MRLLSMILSFCCWLSNQGFGQCIDSDELTYEAYVMGKTAVQSNELWKTAVTVRDRESKDNAGDKNLRYRLLLAQFGLLASTMREKNESLFNEFVDSTEANVENLIKKDNRWGDAKALLSAVYGLRMGYSPWKGMYLGSKSSSLMEKALKENPDSPLVWKLYANSKFFTPEMWGGDLKEAIKAYEKAIHLYETNSHQCKNNWMYLDTMAFLGQAYVKNGEMSKAIRIYEKALALEPEFGWIKHSLLPQAKSKS